MGVVHFLALMLVQQASLNGLFDYPRESQCSASALHDLSSEELDVFLDSVDAFHEVIGFNIVRIGPEQIFDPQQIDFLVHYSLSDKADPEGVFRALQQVYTIATSANDPVISQKAQEAIPKIELALDHHIFKIFARGLILVIDKNKDGEISDKEISKTIKQSMDLGQQILFGFFGREAKQKIKEFVQKIDTLGDGNGQISADEFMIALHYHFDWDNDGLLSRADLNQSFQRGSRQSEGLIEGIGELFRELSFRSVRFSSFPSSEELREKGVEFLLWMEFLNFEDEPQFSLSHRIPKREGIGTVVRPPPQEGSLAVKPQAQATP